jgi:hypothetical protein
MLVVTARPISQFAAAATAATLAGETAEEMPVGSTILNIAVALPIGTELLPTGSAALREEIPCPIARQGPGNRLAGRAAIYPAIALWAELARAIGLAGEERTAQEAVISLAVAPETGMPLEEVPGVLRDTTDRARVPAVTAALPAWDLEVAVAGADDKRRLQK